ncbi:hypothetical protein ACIP5Y_22720 [Nocardia sp. NPDC088792]|uniref:hypothetical protein n=1 Tax=Nocardia sp. NPDC088792 TaxID=3364332 RepID=UPI00382ED7E8
MAGAIAPPRWWRPGLDSLACSDSTVHRATFLARELVAVQDNGTDQHPGYRVESWDRADGAPLASSDLHFSQAVDRCTVLAVPGAVLVIGIGAHTEIVGYRR